MQEHQLMQRAITLARKGRGFVSPNPLVGAVLVAKGEIIGEGYHTACGKPHAEVEAIADAESKGFSVKGATLYVNLEPCCTQGRTPPCTEKIIAKGIAKVVIGMRDPHPKVNGRGSEILRRNGVEVIEGIEEAACRELNKIFIHNQKKHLPYVALKAALTLDGKIGIRGQKVALSSKESLNFSHALRQEYDAILVGAGTVLNDNPRLDVRFCTCKKSHPLRVILDKKAQTPASAAVFRDENYLLYTHKDHYKGKETANIRLFPADRRGHFRLADVLADLYQKGIRSVLVEGGGGVFASFLEQKIPQRGIFILTPRFLPQKDSVPLFADPFVAEFGFRMARKSESGEDTIFEGDFRF